jgi:4-hydroxymandelate synthase
MAAQEIAYAELYTSDERSAVDYFASSFGFTRVAETSGGDSHSSLLRQGTAQLIVTAGAETEEFLEAHGDGIADIAFTCDDVAAVRDRAAAAGALVIDSAPDKTVVSGIFGARHTLVTRSPRTGLPGDRAWVPVPRTPVTGASAAPATRIRLLDHVAVCVESGTLTNSVDFCAAAFDLTKYSSEYIEVGDQAMDSTVVRSRSGSITFTILQQDLTRKSGQVEAFLSRNGGPGVQHLAFLTMDIISAVHEFRGHGVEFLRTPAAYYDMLAKRLPAVHDKIADLRASDVLADCDEWGYLLQLFTRSPYTRNTLFYELVQRDGARGFGSANIKALYEAVERDVQGAG